MSTVDAREEKLPKWAQQELLSLRRVISRLERAMSDDQRFVALSDAFGAERDVLALHEKRPLRSLPQGAMWFFDERDHITVTGHDNNEDPFIQVMGSHPIEVRPRSSNLLEIRSLSDH